VNPLADLQELITTVNSVRTTFVPFVTSRRRKDNDQFFEACVLGIKDTLNDLFNYFKDMDKEFSIYTWKTQKVKIYRLDFLLRQKLDNFIALFGEETKDSKVKKPFGPEMIQDNDGREMWMKCFGQQTLMVPWEQFVSGLENYCQIDLKKDAEHVKIFLNFTETGQLSCYEWAVFLKSFNPLKGAMGRLLEAIYGGLLCGFVPAVEANLLLENKKEGTYLIRYSKTQPGSFAVTFVDNMQKVKHCLLYAVTPSGLTLKNPPTVYTSLKHFADSHQNKLKHPLGNKITLKTKLPGFAYHEVEHAPQTTKEEKSETPTKEDNTNGTCIVCMDAPLETVFLECGHLACCNSCAEKLKLCPICRKPISRIIPIFRAT